MILSRLAVEEDSGPSSKAIDAYAERGLRTLMIARKELNEESPNIRSSRINEEWSDDHEKYFESDLELLGVTALEDLLQDDVKACINQFRDADVKVWMLTGDKGETAKAVSV